VAKALRHQAVVGQRHAEDVAAQNDGVVAAGVVRRLGLGVHVLGGDHGSDDLKPRDAAQQPGADGGMVAVQVLLVGRKGVT